MRLVCLSTLDLSMASYIPTQVIQSQSSKLTHSGCAFGAVYQHLGLLWISQRSDSSAERQYNITTCTSTTTGLNGTVRYCTTSVHQRHVNVKWAELRNTELRNTGLRGISSNALPGPNALDTSPYLVTNCTRSTATPTADRSMPRQRGCERERNRS